MPGASGDHNGGIVWIHRQAHDGDTLGDAPFLALVLAHEQPLLHVTREQAPF